MYTNTSARRSVRGSFGPSKSICSQADSILTIQQKRDLYDQVGEEGLKGGAGAGGGGGGFGGGFPGGGGGGFNGFHAGDPNDIFKYVDPILMITLANPAARSFPEVWEATTCFQALAAEVVDEAVVQEEAGWAEVCPVWEVDSAAVCLEALARVPGLRRHHPHPARLSDLWP
jgi:hypothetical protein